MSDPGDRMDPWLNTIMHRLSESCSDRRAFVSRATMAGISASVAAASNLSWMLRASAAPGHTTTPIAVELQDNGKTLVVAIPQATLGLDPVLASAAGYGDIIPLTDNLTEGLTRFKVGTSEVEPALAETWDVSDDGLTYTFHIRPDVTFHDGTAVDAKAIETNYLRQLDENHPFHFEGIAYAEIVFAGVQSVEATGDLELTITLDRPTVLLPGNLATFAAGIVSPTALEEYGRDFSAHAAGTGPFKLDTWTRDVEIVMVANEDYWGGRPALDRVIWRTIAEDTVRLSELRTGALDVANQIDFKDVETVENSPELQAIRGDFLNTQFLAFNASLAPFDDVRVRQALQHAINKENIAEVVFYGNYTLGAGPIAPSLSGYEPSLEDVYPYDPDKAQALLDEAGLGSFEFDLFNRTTSFWPIVGQLIQADLEAIGIKAHLKSLEDAEFFAELNASNAQAFINDWTWDNGDPDNIMYSLFTAPRAMSRMGYHNPEVDELNMRAQEEEDESIRAELYLEAQKLILDDAIMVTLGYPQRAIGAAANVENLVVSPLGTVVLREVDLA